MKVVIVTGMSGGGKSTALKMLEDMGFFCVDNLPLPLVDRFIQYYAETGGEDQRRSPAALGIDARSFTRQEEIGELLERLDRSDVTLKVVFMESSDETLLHRYKESRRSHPLAKDGRIEDGIAREREILRPLRERADYLIDTSRLLTRQLRGLLGDILLSSKDFQNMVITIMSFGFKNGIPADADLVYDVRFLPNPYYVPQLRERTGREKAVQDYVMSDGTARLFEEKWFDLMDFLLPRYQAEGKTQLVIGVGCTGGKHRSVTLAIHLYEHLAGNCPWHVRMEHRDILR